MNCWIKMTLDSNNIYMQAGLLSCKVTFDFPVDKVIWFNEIVSSLCHSFAFKLTCCQFAAHMCSGDGGRAFRQTITDPGSVRAAKLIRDLGFVLCLGPQSSAGQLWSNVWCYMFVGCGSLTPQLLSSHAVRLHCGGVCDSVSVFSFLQMPDRMRTAVRAGPTPSKDKAMFATGLMIGKYLSYCIMCSFAYRIMFPDGCGHFESIFEQTGDFIYAGLSSCRSNRRSDGLSYEERTV